MKPTDYGFNLEKMPRELARVEAITERRDQVERITPLRAAALKLSRKGLAAAKVELVNHALALAVDLVLETDADGVRPHMDKDGRIAVPLPWTRTGGAAWGLRRTEQRSFNVIMRERSNRESQPLFLYDAESRGWLWGVWSRHSAGAYLRNNPITLVEWRSAWASVSSAWARQNLGRELGLK